jgi:hypothetical protein
VRLATHGIGNLICQYFIAFYAGHRLGRSSLFDAFLNGCLFPILET